MKPILKLSACLILVGLFFAGCEDYLDINTDPNNPTIAPMSGLMASATYETAQNHYRVGDITSYYVQYLASPNPASATDTHEPVSYDVTWENLYDVMTDLSDLEILALEQNATHYLGIARILKAINLGLTIDLWGDLPYSEAFFAQTLSPVFDDQATLYQQIQSLLDQGMVDLSRDGANISVGGDDYIYGGDVNQWRKLAAMVKARYLNRFSKQAQYDPQAVLSALAQGFMSNADDAQMSFFEEQINPWAEVAIDNADRLLGGWVSSQLIEAMDGTVSGVVDPRLPLMVGTTDDGEFVGTDNGAGRGDAPELGARSTLVLDSYYANRTAPLLIATYAEQKFIEAEASLRANQRGRAYQAYLDGIRAHMDKIGVDPTDRDAYLSNPNVAVGEAQLSLEDIFREKYVAMFLHPEAWIDARRFDYAYEGMTLPANHNPSLGGQFIRRLAYPNSEVTRNRGNVPSVQLGDRLVWDQ